MNSRRDAKKLIINLLRHHPEGLMLTEIAKIIGMNRFTVTKYVHELIGNGSVFQKEAAAAKICYLKEVLLEKVRDRDVIEKLRQEVIE